MTAKPLNLACVIDDDNLYVSLIKRIIDMRNLSKDLLVFKNGKEAIEHMESVAVDDDAHIPEVVLLDINMPVMDGWAFLDRFKKLDHEKLKKIDLYVVSSSIDPVDVNRAKQTEVVNDYLIKPMKIDTLEKIFSRKSDKV